MERIILASGSPRRKELLELAGIPFEVIVSDAEEHTEKRLPGEIVEELSAIKAQAVAKDHPGRLVLGSDTVVVKDGKILGKPKDKEEAIEMIRSIQGTFHEVYTGVTFMRDEWKCSFHEAARVEVYPMSEEEIMDYVDSGDSMDKAGAYGIQGMFARHIKGIEGEYQTIVGLPIGRVWQELKKLV
ncbi:MAG: Maf family protein [Eubacteriales bacterium]|nr:Maf family protein [Eubacteriales bacterium]